MKYQVFVELIFISLLFSGCNQNSTPQNSTPNINTSLPLLDNAKCSIYQNNFGIFINNTGSTDIDKFSVSFKIDWIDSYNKGLVEKHKMLDKNYMLKIPSGEVKQFDNLSVCLPEERKGKSNLFKCTAIVNSPCESEKTFAIAYNYYKNGTEKFTSPPLKDYITMYKNLKAQFG